ncbi:MAG: bifunctional oligoribonuclease/PAP phosphatase NrnA [Patescibacteria group bacterium]|nr:bifunctional oligoribonuclease/PAP phosphatase NrnA [Patescibacteria group bacterium]
MEIFEEKFESLSRVFDKIQNPLLIIHPKPDADALGCSFALANFLNKKKNIKKADIFSVDEPAKDVSALFPVSEIKNTFKIDRHDALIFLDRVDLFYKLEVAEAMKKLEKPPMILAIDHHPNSFIPKSLTLLDTKAAATSEIIFRFFNHIGHDINHKVAQYLLNGIYADTGGFRHNNTTAQSLEISSQLMRKGASITKVHRALFANKSLNTLKLWGVALERAQVNQKTGMAVSFITKKDLKRCGATPHDLNGISEILNTISDSKFALVLYERAQDKIKASLRSEEYKQVDVSEIARQFMGGGHKLASGFEIKGHLRQIGDNWIIE